jgi:hypothetical protein
MRLALSVSVKGSKPFVPLLNGGFGLLEVNNDGVFQRRKEVPVGDGVVLPTVDGTADIVVRLSLKPGTIPKVKGRTLDVVELKRILLEDKTDTSGLNPQKRRKEHVECPTPYTNERKGAIIIDYGKSSKVNEESKCVSVCEK